MNVPMPGSWIPPTETKAPSEHKPRKFSEKRDRRAPLTHKPFAGSQELEDLKDELELSALKYKSKRNNKENNR